MKRYFCTLVILLIATMGFAQTQQGFVKTKGRMVNGKLVPGQGLKGASVSIKGRTAVVVQNDNGSFSFPIPSQTFMVTNVQKNGYQLVDDDVIRNSYTYSSNPIYLVMETPDQQLQDQLTAERKIRRNLQKQLQDREDKIEALKAEQQISDEEYRAALQKLYQDQENNEQLIKDMAKRYSELDYDQLDEFYRQVSYCIENGELVKADSLLNTKGDVTQQVEAQLRKGQAIQEQETQLNQAKAVHAADLEELAHRCYSYYETFAAQHLNDTAAYYLELRASLDTTNVGWQDKVGHFLYSYLANYDKALRYYQIGLRQAIAQFGEDSYCVADFCDNIGIVFRNQGDYGNALEYFNKALAIWEDVYWEDGYYAAECCDSIGFVYINTVNYALVNSIYSCDNIGIVYRNQGDYGKALEYFNKALNFREAVFWEDDFSLAISYYYIGLVYIDQGNYGKALEYYNKYLAIQKSVLGENHPDVAESYGNIGSMFSDQGDYGKALEYLNKALTIRRSVYGENHPKVIKLQNAIMKIEYKQSLNNNTIHAFNEIHCYTATIVEGDTPASQQGMLGEYILLEFSDWNQDSQTSLFDKNTELRGKPKDILIMKDGQITQHHFENTIGAQLGIKHVSQEDRQRINKAYEEWKKQNRQ